VRSADSVHGERRAEVLHLRLLLLDELEAADLHDARVVLDPLGERRCRQLVPAAQCRASHRRLPLPDTDAAHPWNLRALQLRPRIIDAPSMALRLGCGERCAQGHQRSAASDDRVSPRHDGD